MERITIKDVAKHAGVSVTSVSRVLNNRGYLSEELKSKVNKAIEELNYTPNEIARSFYRKESNSIALIVPSISNPFFSELSFFVEQELAQVGYNLYICNSMNNAKNEKKYLKLLNEDRVDGILVASHNIGIEEYSSISDSVVSIERNISENIPTVSSDNYEGGRLATQHLIDLGSRNIVCIMGDQNIDMPANLRAKAYWDIMELNNLMPNLVEIPFNIPYSERLLQTGKILEKYPEVDGIFAGDDVEASVVLNIAKKMMIKVPSQLQIVGFDGTAIMRQTLPHLTTIVQPIERIAQESVKTLLKVIKGQRVNSSTILPVSFKAGATTRGVNEYE